MTKLKINDTTVSSGGINWKCLNIDIIQFLFNLEYLHIYINTQELDWPRTHQKRKRKRVD